MYCTKCGKQISVESNFCSFCGARVQLPKEDQSEKTSFALEHTLTTIKVRFPLDESVLNTELLPTSDVKQIRPWVRFWARLIDITVVSIFVGLLVGILIPHGLDWELFSIFIRIISAILLEAFLLSTWGMTLGKSLLQVYVRDTQGRKLNFSQAIKRCISAWTWGLGFGIPVVSLILAYMSYERIQETGVARWDIEADSLVSHKRIGFPRIAAVVALFTGLIWLEFMLLV